MSETEVDVVREFGDTLRIVVGALNEDGTARDISAWTSITMFINPKKEPLTNDANMLLSGVKLAGGVGGMMYFIPTGTEAGGNYYYEIKAIDGNGEKRTFLKGRYKVIKGAGAL